MEKKVEVLFVMFFLGDCWFSFLLELVFRRLNERVEVYGWLVGKVFDFGLVYFFFLFLELGRRGFRDFRMVFVMSRSGDLGGDIFRFFGVRLVGVFVF